jgi:hypothetical protein
VQSILHVFQKDLTKMPFAALIKMEFIKIVAIEPNVFSTLHAMMPDLMAFAVPQWKGSTWPAVMTLPILLNPLSPRETQVSNRR